MELVLADAGSLLDRHPLAFDLLVILGAAVAGCFGALVGLGGGILVTPLLVLGCGMDMKTAMGASLLAVIATSSGAAANRTKDSLSNYRVGMFLEVAATIGAVVGALLAALADPAWLALLFGCLLIVTAILTWRKKEDTLTHHLPVDPMSKRLRLDSRYETRDGWVRYHIQRPMPGFAVMIAAGMISGLLGIGSGVLKVVAMDSLMKMPFRVSTTTSNFMIGLTAVASVSVYTAQGFMDPLVAAPVLLGIVPGAMIGARLVTVLKVRMLRTLFLLALLIIAAQMLFRGFGELVPT
ncbi:MAG: sulfite exporter TauE/SafE family protein [Phycisphaerae bacterium]|nr:sulfite exporter TauE/SafE family protein [Phycisphaerae bacterium]